jgi:hypothetical protein
MAAIRFVSDETIHNIDFLNHQLKVIVFSAPRVGDQEFVRECYAKKLAKDKILNFVEIIRPALFERLNDKSTVSEAEMEYIIEYQISAVIGVLNLWVARDRDIPVEKMTQIIVQISSGGVLTMVQGKIKEQM